MPAPFALLPSVNQETKFPTLDLMPVYKPSKLLTKWGDARNHCVPLISFLHKTFILHLILSVVSSNFFFLLDTPLDSSPLLLLEMICNRSCKRTLLFTAHKRLLLRGRDSSISLSNLSSTSSYISFIFEKKFSMLESYSYVILSSDIITNCLALSLYRTFPYPFFSFLYFSLPFLLFFPLLTTET